jgi:hypothetical protein
MCPSDTPRADRNGDVIVAPLWPIPKPVPLRCNVCDEELGIVSTFAEASNLAEAHVAKHPTHVPIVSYKPPTRFERLRHKLGLCRASTCPMQHTIGFSVGRLADIR